MGLIEGIKSIFTRENSRKKVNKINDLVVLPDKSQKTVAQVIFMAGQYAELQKQYDELRIENHELREKLLSVKIENKQEEKISLDSLNDSDMAVLELIKKEKLNKSNFVEMVTENKGSPVKSRASALRIRKKLLDLNKITYEGGYFKAIEEAPEESQ